MPYEVNGYFIDNRIRLFYANCEPGEQRAYGGWRERERARKKGFMVNHIKISEHERALGLIENENFGKIKYNATRCVKAFLHTAVCRHRMCDMSLVINFYFGITSSFFSFFLSHPTVIFMWADVLKRI